MNRCRKFAKTLISLLLASPLLAQVPCPVVISSPTNGSQWTIGQNVTLSAHLNGPQTVSPAFVDVDGTEKCSLTQSSPSCSTTLTGLALGSHRATWGCGGGTAGGNTFTVVPKTVAGYINPKYAIWGVTYAPPGPTSFVDYTNSVAESTTNSVNSSFSTTFATSLTTGVSFGPPKGWRAGVSTTVSNSYTQTATSKSSVQITKSTGRGDRTFGPSDPYVGINHDYDIVWIWLNPIELFTVNKDASNHVLGVVWNGYGYSELDQPAMDVYPAYVGWLNGDIAMTPSQAAPLQRAWAAGELWPTGTGPGLTGPGPGTDFENIAKTDPYWQCTSKPASCPTAVDPIRYKLTTNVDFLYLQAPVGGPPITQTYTDSYAVTNTMEQGASSSTTQTFATESTFGTKSDFWISFSSTLKTSNSWTSTNGWDSSLGVTNSSSAMLSITGPPCNVVGSTCSPVYNKSTQFDLYEDNLFGTFYLNPVN